MPSPVIRRISDTALWVAAYRALESERPDALFNDPYARRMAGARGFEIIRALPMGHDMSWSIVVRTALMDETILRCVSQGACTVLNLGAGLDARPFRLNLPETLEWIDVDLAHTISYRRRGLKGAVATCKHSDVCANVCDSASLAKVLASLKRRRTPLLVLTEGLLVYLSPQQVKQVALQLRSECLARWWLTDLLGPLALSTVGLLWQAQLNEAGAGLQFAHADSARFFATCGWREVEYRSIWEESFALGRPMPLATGWSSVLKLSFPLLHESLRTAAGVALMERTEGSQRTSKLPAT